MAGISMGFEVLSTLNEGDERITLSEILSFRDGGLSDLELWAVCRECCLALLSVHNSLDMFQTLCITPDSLAFDSSGTVCFLDLGSDPEDLYVPPEYESLGNSYKAHIFSLGMTMLYAAEYSSEPAAERHLGADVNSMILEMTCDDWDLRLELEEVIARCQDNLDGCSVTSERICQQLVAGARLESSIDDDMFSDTRSLNTPLDMLQEMWLASNNPESGQFMWQGAKSRTPSGPSCSSSRSVSPESESPPSGLERESLNTENGNSIMENPSVEIPDSNSEDSSLSPHYGLITPPDLYRNQGYSRDSSRSRSPSSDRSKVNIAELSSPRENSPTNVFDYSDNVEQFAMSTPLHPNNRAPTNNFDVSVICGNHDANRQFANGDSPTILPPQDFNQNEIKPEEINNCGKESDAKIFTEVKIPQTETEEIIDAADDDNHCLDNVQSRRIAQDSNTIHHQITCDNDHVCGIEDSSTSDSDWFYSCQDDITYVADSGVSVLIIDSRTSEPVDCNIPSSPKRIDIIADDKTLNCVSDICVSAAGGEDIIAEDARAREKNDGNFSMAVVDDSVITQSPSIYSPLTNTLNDASVTAIEEGNVLEPFIVSEETGQVNLRALPPRTKPSEEIVNSCSEDDVIKRVSVVEDAVCAVSARDGGVDRIGSELATYNNSIMGNETSSEDGDNSPGNDDRETATSPVKYNKDQIHRKSDIKVDKPRNKTDVNINEEPRTGQCVLEILEKLGAFHENELWSLNRECVLALQRNKQELPAYVSLETVVIETDGHVTFCGVSEDKELEAVYLAPELQNFGMVTDKTCLFGLAAMLWSAADYCLPANEEPELSVEFENLLMSMTQEDVEDRPPLSSVLQVCDDYLEKQDITSSQICATLFAESSKAAAYGKGNALIRDILNKELQDQTVSIHAELMEKIRTASVNLRPANERVLADLPPDLTLHHRLMSSIKTGVTLNMVHTPKLYTVCDLYVDNPKFLADLPRITGKPKLQMEETEQILQSAFKNIPKTATKSAIDNPDDTIADVTIPEEYSSIATHFMPIVVNDRMKKSPQQKLSSRFVSQKQLPTAKTDEIVKNIKELKKNLLRMQSARTLVEDLEKDAQQEENGSASSPALDVPKQPPVMKNSSPRNADMVNPSTTVTSASLVTNQTISPPHFTKPAQMPQVSPQVQRSNQVQGHFENAQGAYNLPMSFHPGILPFQCQLQQDPRTGLFQIVPVALSQSMAMHTVTSSGTVAGSSSIMPFFSLPGNMLNQNLAMSANQNLAMSTNQNLAMSTNQNSAMSAKDEKSSEKKHRSKHRERSKRTNYICECSDCEKCSSRREHSCLHIASDQSRHAPRQSNSRTPEDDISPRSVLRSDSARYPSVEEGHDSKSDAINYEEHVDYDSIPNNIKPMRLRQLKAKDSRSKLKRAKSGSSLDYRRLYPGDLVHSDIFEDPYECEEDEISPHEAGAEHRSQSLYTSQPDLNSHFGHNQNLVGAEARRMRRRNASSPDLIPSPSLSPSLSKDSGISGLNLRGMGDASLMDRLLNSDTIRHQQRLSRVIRLLRDEVAYEGYLENGVEDMAMADYIMSLANLRWDTFNNAITEKFCDLFWEEDLLCNLYEAVNGYKPARSEKSVTPTTVKSDDGAGSSHENSSSHHSNSDSGAFRVVNESHQATNEASLSRPQWLHNKDAMVSPRDSDSDQEMADARQKWLNYRKRMERSKSLEVESVTNLSIATYLRNSSIEDSTKKYSGVDAGNDYELSSARSIDSKGEAVVMTTDSLINGSMLDTDSIDLDPFIIRTDSTRNSIRNTADAKSKSLYNLNYDSDASSNSEYRIIRSGQGHGQRSTNQNLPMVSHSVENLQQMPQIKHVAPAQKAIPQKKAFYSKSEANLYTTTESDVDVPLFGAYSEIRLTSGSVRVRRCEVAYYHADVDLSRKEELADYVSQQESQLPEALESRLHEIDQEMMMEHRNRRKTLKYFMRLAETTGKLTKTQAADQKSQMLRTTMELEKCQQSICFLDHARKYIEMLYCEQWGLDAEFLYALSKCPGDRAMLLSPCDNPLVQYQSVRVGARSMDTHILQAGTPIGLMTQLFAQTALSNGYVHEFFFCFRYFVSPPEVLQFLINKYGAAVLSLSPGSQMPLKVKSRALDLLYMWLDGYYSIDFENSPEMLTIMEDFIRNKAQPNDPCAGDLKFLFEECQDGHHVDLVFSSNIPKVSSSSEVRLAKQEVHVPKKWESFKAALHFSAKPMKLQRLSRSSSVACIDRKSGIGDLALDNQMTGVTIRQGDFLLTNYSPQLLAEQLTLMEQELFQRSHPVHYLNSKAQGIGVAMMNSVLNKAQSVNFGGTAWEDHCSSNLFVGSHCFHDIIQRLIEHAHGIAFWVAAEIVTCSSTKIQTSTICHLINTAKICAEIRNFATCLAIVEGLENVIVRQLPTWKNIPSKYCSVMEDLSSLLASLKSDSRQLETSVSGTRCPTIPYILLFLLHVQREEVGGFTLANSMFKWTKIRSISKMVDQIRIFQQTMYDYQSDISIQEALRQRKQHFSQHNLTVLASQQNNNVQRIPTKRIGGALWRMKQRLQPKNE